LTTEGGGGTVLRKDEVEIGNSGSGYVGVLRSPLFGQPVSSNPARRLQLQLQLEF